MTALAYFLLYSFSCFLNQHGFPFPLGSLLTALKEEETEDCESEAGLQLSNGREQGVMRHDRVQRLTKIQRAPFLFMNLHSLSPISLVG